VGEVNTRHVGHGLAAHTRHFVLRARHEDAAKGTPLRSGQSGFLPKSARNAFHIYCPEGIDRASWLKVNSPIAQHNLGIG
jgi:hypothetical protein